MSRTSGAVQPQLRVFRPDGSALPGCAGSTGGTLLKLTCALDATGTYTLLATDLFGDGTGDYGLTLLQQ